MMGVQGAMAEEVQNRMRKATGEIGDKYAAGHGGRDDNSDTTGPTGATYKEKDLAERKARKLAKAKKAAESGKPQQKAEGENDEEGDDGSDEDEDNDLRRIRAQRLKQIRNAQNEKLENMGKGHGQYREITQDEFLNEMVSSRKVVCHFYHAEFTRCAVIDHHIQKLVQRHVETKFVKINAEKAPFFVSKVMLTSGHLNQLALLYV
jgi:chromatin remodeling complex protein RSC6